MKTVPINRSMLSHCRKLLVLAATSAAVITCTTALAADVRWDGWNLHSDGYPNTEGMEQFSKLLSERSDGRIELTVHNDGALGTQGEAIDKLIANDMAVANLSLGPLGQIAPATNVVSLPFIFRDIGHMHRAMDGQAGDIISADLEKKGIVALAWYDSGARSFYNSEGPINSPADIAGKTFRVMGNDLYSGMISAMGGTPVKLPFTQVLSALQVGDIDGAENNWPSYESTTHYKEAGFYSLSQHLIIPECICLNADVYNALSDDDKELVKTAARESSVLQRDLWEKRALASREQVLSAGVKFNEVSNKRAFQGAMRPVYGKYLAKNPSLAPLVDIIRNTD